MLEREHVNVWTDLALDAGADWIQEIESALSASKFVVLLLSPRYLESGSTSFERALALRAAQDSDKIVLPVLVKPVDPSSVPTSIRRLHLIDATRNIDGAVRALQQAIASAA
jgi:hypothetical protein